MKQVPTERYDVVIFGAGLAGLSLARQLLLQTEKTVLLVDRLAAVPSPRQKVGEATVQVSGYYLSKVLDLEEHLFRDHFMKYNLRFLWPTPGRANDGYEDYTQAYIQKLSNIASYQLDRNKLEAELLRRNLENPRFAWRAPVADLEVDLVDVDGGEAPHVVRFTHDGAAQRVECGWAVDATGRGKLFAKRLGSAAQERHPPWQLVPVGGRPARRREAHRDDAAGDPPQPAARGHRPPAVLAGHQPLHGRRLLVLGDPAPGPDQSRPGLRRREGGPRGGGDAGEAGGLDLRPAPAPGPRPAGAKDRRLGGLSRLLLRLRQDPRPPLGAHRRGRPLLRSALQSRRRSDRDLQHGDRRPGRHRRPRRAGGQGAQLRVARAGGLRGLRPQLHPRLRPAGRSRGVRDEVRLGADRLLRLLRLPVHQRPVHRPPVPRRLPRPLRPVGPDQRQRHRLPLRLPAVERGPRPGGDGRAALRRLPRRRSAGRRREDLLPGGGGRRRGARGPQRAARQPRAAGALDRRPRRGDRRRRRAGAHRPRLHRRDRPAQLPLRPRRDGPAVGRGRRLAWALRLGVRSGGPGWVPARDARDAGEGGKAARRTRPAPAARRARPKRTRRPRRRRRAATPPATAPGDTRRARGRARPPAASPTTRPTVGK